MKLGRAAVEAIHAAPEVTSLLSEVLDQPLPPAARGELQFSLSLLLEQTGGDPAERRRLCIDAVDELDDRPDLQAWAMVALGVPTAPGVPASEHLRWLHRSLEIVPRLEDPVFRVFLWGKAAMVLVAMGDPAWQGLVDRIVAQTRGAPGPRREVNAYDSVGIEACYAGHHDTADQSQAGLRELLVQRGVDFTPFWIMNTIRVTGDRALVDELAARPEVAEILADRTYPVPEPEPAPAPPRVEGVEWGLERIGAPDVWGTFGVHGEGIVVGVIDTGALFTHEAIVEQYRGNQGDGGFDHDYHWWDPSQVCGNPSLAPCDNHGHGTHVTGTIVGDDGGDNQIGVAPAARWIAAKGCEDQGCSASALLSSGQFMLAPTDLAGENPRPDLRPHVVNNSWGGAADADPWFRATIEAWVAAGIFPQFAAGNTQNGVAPCGSASNPGNLPLSHAAGAFDSTNTIAAFSNRGPSAWGDAVKPDIAAPGVGIRSAWIDGGYAAGDGTSMASPHVAGAVALLWSAAPTLARDVPASRSLLGMTAIDMEDVSCGGTPEHNNVWGEGRLDVSAAVEQAPRGPSGVLDGTVRAAADDAPIAGATITVTGPVTRTTETGPDGAYQLPLPVGSYEVGAAARRYLPHTEPGVVVEEGQTTTRDFALEPAPPEPELTVEPAEVKSVQGPDQVVTQTLTVGNAGTAELRWSVSQEGPECEAPGGTPWVDVAPTAGTVAPGDDQTVSVVFDSTDLPLGERTAGLCLESDDPHRPSAVVPLRLVVAQVPAWEARYDGPGHSFDGASTMVVSPDGSRVFVTGSSIATGANYDYATVAYDTGSGDQVWVARYDGPASNIDFATGVAVSPDGSRVFVTGYSAPSYDYATVSYDAATGAQLWVASYDGPGLQGDLANAVGVSPDGAAVYVTGRSTGVGTNDDYATVAYDAATGEERWVARYNGTGGGHDTALAVGVNPDDGTVVVTGQSPGPGTDFDYATVAYDPATGAERWVARYDGPRNRRDVPEAVGLTPDGSRVFVTGRSEGVGYDYGTVAYDAGTGDELWVSRYHGPTGIDTAWDLAVSPDGSGVFVTGQSTGANLDFDYATVAYRAADGSEQWVSRYAGPTNQPDSAEAVGVSPDGAAVFVTGQSPGAGTGNDYTTATYDAATGEELSVARYNGSGNGGDIAYAMAVSPDGSGVFVTGWSPGAGTGTDYATLAYEHDAAMGTLAGTVTDANDELPLAGVTVTATSGGFVRTVTAGDDGTYHLDLPLAEWTVELRAGSYQTASRQVTVAADGDALTRDVALRTGRASVDPESIELTVPVGAQDTAPVTLSNTGSAPLTWRVTDEAPSWIDAAPRAGTLAPGDAADLLVTLDASNLPPGGYSAELMLSTDAGRRPAVAVPVRLEVVIDPDDQRRVNAGGRGYTGADGDRWAGDLPFHGDFGHELQSRRLRTQQPIEGTEDDALYQHARVGEAFAYRFDGLEDGRYEVELHFAEIERREAGERRFDVVADGGMLLAGYDIAADAGVRAPAVHRSTIEVTDGGVRIWFLSRRDSAPALVSAVQLTRVGGLPGSPTGSPGPGPW